MPPDGPVLTITEIATRWRVHPETVRRIAARGDFPGAFRAGSQWRVPLEDVVAVEREGRQK